MAANITLTPESVDQFLDHVFGRLSEKLAKAGSDEEQAHLITDAQQYVRGARDFLRSAGGDGEKRQIESKLETARRRLDQMLGQVGPGLSTKSD